MVQRYLTSEAGANGFRQWLIRHDYTMVMYPQEVMTYNSHFHFIIKTNQETFYCLFKKSKEHWSKDTVMDKPDWFWTFPQKFKEFFVKYPNLNSAGESINTNKFTRCINEHLTIIFIYPNGSFYTVDKDKVLEVHNLAKEFYPEGYNPEYPDDEGFIRTQKKVNDYFENLNDVEVQEKTISFPVKLLVRLED
jgi:hypothetical protein